MKSKWMAVWAGAAGVCCLMTASAAAGGPVPAPAPAQASVIPARDLQADLAILKRAYEELHPGLYRYNGKAEMASHWSALAAELDRDLTLQQAYLAFSKFLAKVRCGHTYANFFNQPKAVAAELFEKPGRVPFYFRWIDRRMIVTRDFTLEQSPETSLPPGTEVLAIDGVPAAAILERLLTVARADGSNDAKRINYLEVLGGSDYEAFDVYFPLFFPQTGSRMTLQVRRPAASETAVVSVQPLTYEQRVAPVKAAVEARRGGGDPGWEFRHLDGQTASLRMPTWALYNSKWDWQGFLTRAFDEMAQKQTANLILDLRGNEGGMDVGDFILGRLIRQDLKLEPAQSLQPRVRYRQVPADLVPYLDTWDRSFDNWGEAAVDPKDGFYRLTRYEVDGEEVIKAAGRPFAGRVFVLVDAANSSATFQFAQTVQQHKLATLAGQPTGGNQRGINGGAFYFLRLPHSRIEVDLPLIGYFPAAERPDAGLQPDVRVEPDVNDVAQGVDTEMKALLRLLQAGSAR